MIGPSGGGAPRVVNELVDTTLSETIALHQRMRAADPTAIVDAATAIVETITRDGTLLIFGNGGSATDAQHLAAELVGRFQRERRALPAIALTTDASVLTAITNDYAFERVFSRQVEALGKRGDVAFGISTSGRSTNIVAALEAARARSLQTIALTGRDGGAVGRAAAIHINVPSDSTPRVQEVHRTVLHIICDMVERAFA